MPEDIFTLTGIDDDTLQDFSISLHEALNSLEFDIGKLEKDPSDSETTTKIYSTMHSIKGNCIMCSILPFIDYSESIEEVVSQLRSGQIPFTHYIKEALLLGLDKFRSDTNSMLLSGSISTAPLKKIANTFKRLTQASQDDTNAIAAEIIKMISGSAAIHLPLSEKQIDNSPNQNTIQTPDSDDDVKYFKELAMITDDNSPFWEGRSKKAVNVCLGINQMLANPIDSRQLMAASYLHDIGMAFVPYEILNKNAKLNSLEEKKVQLHVKHSYEWLKRIPGWADAAHMVLQHHERVDGTGYPNHTEGKGICTGAKILAVADTFYAVTNQRADRSFKRSLVRATSEINSCVGTQFDGEVVAAFSDMIQNMHAK